MAELALGLVLVLLTLALAPLAVVGGVALAGMAFRRLVRGRSGRDLRRLQAERAALELLIDDLHRTARAAVTAGDPIAAQIVLEQIERWKRDN